jgi:aromatic ring hydroxylase
MIPVPIIIDGKTYLDTEVDMDDLYARLDAKENLPKTSTANIAEFAQFFTVLAKDGEKTSSGTFFPNAIYVNVGRRLTGETIYHEFNLLAEIAGGLAVTLSYEDDFNAKETREWLEKYIMRNPKVPPQVAHRIWRLVENLLASSMVNWHQIAGVHGGGSPVMETIALN